MNQIDINEYLNIARLKARKYGYDGTIELSDRIDKKLKFTDRLTGKVIHFGAKDYYDKIIYKLLYGKAVANDKAELYRLRAWSVFNKSKALSPSSLSWYILW
jgi:hypothetical protein